MEEEESMKFSILARLCHNLDISIFLIIQNAKGDTENPMGSKKGGHEASIIMRIEKTAPDKNDIMQSNNLYDENKRIIKIQKNKQSGKHFKEELYFDTKSLSFYTLEQNKRTQGIDMKMIEAEFKDEF